MVFKYVLNLLHSRKMSTVSLPLTLLVQSEYNVRMQIDSRQVKSMVKSITHGVKPPPICVVEREDGHYEVIDGYHRWKAYEDLGRTHIKATVCKNMSPEELVAMSITLNKGINNTKDEIAMQGHRLFLEGFKIGDIRHITSSDITEKHIKIYHYVATSLRNEVITRLGIEAGFELIRYPPEYHEHIFNTVVDQGGNKKKNVKQVATDLGLPSRRITMPKVSKTTTKNRMKPSQVTVPSLEEITEHILNFIEYTISTTPYTKQQVYRQMELTPSMN